MELPVKGIRIYLCKKAQLWQLHRSHREVHPQLHPQNQIQVNRMLMVVVLEERLEDVLSNGGNRNTVQGGCHSQWSEKVGLFPSQFNETEMLYNTILESTEKLAELAATHFSAIQNSGQIPRPIIPDHPFGEHEMGVCQFPTSISSLLLNLLHHLLGRPLSLSRLSWISMPSNCLSPYLTKHLIGESSLLHS